MPKMHARKKQIAELKEQLCVKHTDAIKILGDERAELICELIEEYADLNTYAETVAYIETSPRFQILCEKCGWTLAMICPECPGCGCYNGQCSGWRHAEYAFEDDDEHDDPNACPECGAGGGGDPYGECYCYDEDDQDEDEPAGAAVSA